MSYTYVSAMARPIAPHSPWQSVDIGDMVFSELYKNYSRVVATLNNPVYGAQDLYLDLADVRAAQGLIFNSINFVTYLQRLGNASLPTTTVKPLFSQTPVVYKDAFAAGYLVDISDHRVSDDSIEDPLNKHDLILSKAGVSTDYITSRALVTVNGLVHFTGSYNGNFYALKGGDTCRRANDNQVGILSFASVADIQLIPLTADMIYKQNVLQLMRNYTYLNTGVSFQNKTPLLVIGGYLHAMDDGYSVVGDGLLRIDFNNMPLFERFFESRKLIDLSSLDLETTTANESQVAIDDYLSDAALTAYLTLSQSFIVLVDTPFMYRQMTVLEPSQLPGRYYTNAPLQFPLRLGVGRLENYLLRHEQGVYTYACVDSTVNNYRFRGTDYLDFTSIDDSRNPNKPKSYAQGSLLEFGKISQ